MFEGLFQPMHLLVILTVCMLVFGPKKLPELGKGLGDGIRAFRDSIKDPAPSTAAKVEDSKPVAGEQAKS